MKKWYAVYTKHHCEKKLSSNLRKRKVENYCPLNRIIKKSVHDRESIVLEPLFNGVVFVNISEDEIPVIRSIGTVINFLYWLDSPAEISLKEIETIKEFLNQNYNVKIVKSVVEPHKMIHYISDEKQSRKEENIIHLTYAAVRVNLPSIGYILIAENRTLQSERIKYYNIKKEVAL